MKLRLHSVDCFNFLPAVEALWQVLAGISDVWDMYTFLTGVTGFLWESQSHSQVLSKAKSRVKISGSLLWLKRVTILTCLLFLQCSMYKGDSLKIFGELLCIKETRYTLCLPVQSSKYKGNSGKFFPGIYGWILKVKRFEIWPVWLVSESILQGKLCQIFNRNWQLHIYGSLRDSKTWLKQGLHNLRTLSFI